MRQESYKILAEHFADKAGLRVEFQDGACPSTDGDTILLPSEVNDQCVNPLIGALLHETAHVKHTVSPYEVFRNMGEFTKACVNALEDIRVDYITSLKYPNSFDFIRELTNSVIERRANQLKTEPVPVQVLKSIILKAEGIEPSTIYDNPKTLETAKLCEKYIDEAKACIDTWHVVTVARRLLADILGKDKAEREQLQEQADKANQAYEKMGEFNDQYKEVTGELTRIQDERYQKALAINKQAGVANRINRERAQQENSTMPGAKERAEQLAEKAKQKQAVIDIMKKDYEKTGAEAQAKSEERNKLSKEFNEERETQEEADEAMQEKAEEAKLNQCQEGYSLSGFSALDGEDLKPDYSAKLETKTIDEVIADAVLRRKDEAIIDEQGNRLNNGALADYVTDPEKLFMVKEQRHDLTKVAFVIDVSGSMGGFGEHDKLSLAFDTLDVLLRAVKGAIDQGAPCDVSLYAFGTECGRVLNSLATYETKTARELINTARNQMGGGTCLLNAVNMVSADLLAEAEHRTIILITDAEVDERDCTEIINKTSSDCKQVFIAVRADLDGVTRELFGHNNIHERKDAMDIIGQALYQSI